MLLSIKPQELFIGSNPHPQQAVWAVYRVAAWTGQPRDDQTPSSHSWQGISLQSKIPIPNRLYEQWADQCGDAILKCITPALQHLFIGQNPHPKKLANVLTSVDRMPRKWFSDSSFVTAPLYRAKSPSQRNWPMYCPGNDSQIPHLSLHLFIGQNAHLEKLDNVLTNVDRTIRGWSSNAFNTLLSMHLSMTAR